MRAVVERDGAACGEAQARGRRRRHLLAVLTGLAVLALVLFIASLSVGRIVVGPGEALWASVGRGQASTVFVIQQLRLPRAAAALVCGAALGLSGTLFQRVLGNPLASPDFLGVGAGAGTAVAALLILGPGTAAVAAGTTTGLGVTGALMLPVVALAGGSGTAALIYFFAWRQGVSTYRFILVGIGVSAFAGSLTSYLIARARFSDARAVLTWLTGSVGAAGPVTTLSVAVVVAGVAVVGWPLARAVRVLELGEDLARGLGARVQRERLVVLGVAVVLVSTATAAVGPLAFVAMLAGPLAALVGVGRSIIAAALVGAVTLQVADLAAQHALPWPLSTGVVTGVLGAPYIVWVLVRAAREGRSG